MNVDGYRLSKVSEWKCVLLHPLSTLNIYISRCYECTIVILPNDLTQCHGLHDIVSDAVYWISLTFVCQQLQNGSVFYCTCLPT